MLEWGIVDLLNVKVKIFTISIGIINLFVKDISKIVKTSCTAYQIENKIS